MIWSDRGAPVLGKTMLVFAFFVAILLITSGFLLISYTVDHCRYGSDTLYVSLILFSPLLMLFGFLLLLLILGFFPQMPFPHFDLF